MYFKTKNKYEYKYKCNYKYDYKYKNKYFTLAESEFSEDKICFSSLFLIIPVSKGRDSEEVTRQRTPTEFWKAICTHINKQYKQSNHIN